MATSLHDLRHNAILGTSIYPAAALTATCTGVGVNLTMSYENAFAILEPGAIAADPLGTYNVKLQSSQNDNKADEFAAADPYVDIPGATFDTITSADSKADPKVIEFRAPEPWVRAVATVAGSPTTGANFGVLIGAQRRFV